LYQKAFPHLRHLYAQLAHSQVHDADMPLLEIYIAQFLGLVNQLVKRGIRSDYVAVQKNARFLKGRLGLSQQLRKNSFHQERFFIEYQEYQVNRPANRSFNTLYTGCGEQENTQCT
jgi:5-methylcytosine-specific restriction enzyme subunit McrC